MEETQHKNQMKLHAIVMKDHGVNRWSSKAGSSGTSRRLDVVEDMTLDPKSPLLTQTVQVELVDPDTNQADKRDTLPPRAQITVDITSFSFGQWGVRFNGQIAPNGTGGNV